MKVFVTGVAGFLGSHLAQRLLEMGHDVVGCDTLLGGELANVPPEVEFYQYDCCDFNAMLKISRKCEVVYHCAATAYEGLSVFSPHVVTRNIFEASVSVFSAAIENKVKRIVFCSSMARYGKNVVPFREEYEPKPVDPYGISKLAAEHVLANLCEVHGIEYVIAVPHNIIGPRQKFDDPYRNVASIMINRMLLNNPPIIYGDGEQMRCFSFVEDCLQCLIKMIDDPDIVGEVINIGPDEEFITINNLAARLIKMVGFKGEPIYMPGRPQEVKMATCSADKARKLLGYKTKTKLDDGLNTMVDWIRQTGARKFRYHLEIEIHTESLPDTWGKKLM